MFTDSLKKFKNSLENFQVDSRTQAIDDPVHDDISPGELFRNLNNETRNPVTCKSDLCCGGRPLSAKEDRPKKSKVIATHRRELKLLKQLEFGSAEGESGGSSTTSRTDHYSAQEGKQSEKRLQAEYLIPTIDIKKPKISNCAPAVGGFKTVVIPHGYPKVHLTYQQAEEVVALIVDRIDHLEPEAGMYPGFEDHYFTSGACILICKDESSRLWVNNVVKNFRLEGVALQTAGTDVLVKGIKAGAYFPGKKLSPEKLLNRLKVQNPIVDFSGWSVLCIKEEQNGFFGIFRIPEDIFKKLGWDTFSLYFNIGKIIVRTLKKRKTELKIEYQDKQTCTTELEKVPKIVTSPESDVRKKAMFQEAPDSKPTTTSGLKVLEAVREESIVALGSSGEMPVRPLLTSTLESMSRSLGGTHN